MQIHIVPEFDDINVYASSIFFGLVIIMLMKSDPDSVRNNIFADAYAVGNIFVDVNAVNIFLLLTLTSSIYLTLRARHCYYTPVKKYLQLCGGDEHRQLLVRLDRRCTSEHTVKNCKDSSEA